MNWLSSLIQNSYLIDTTITNTQKSQLLINIQNVFFLNCRIGVVFAENIKCS